MVTYLIIGNGVAGNSAAEMIRKIDNQGKILLFSRETYYFYYTPILPEYLSGERTLKSFTTHNDNWYTKNNIDLHLETEITAIDASRKTVFASRGEEFRYDKLLLATGGYSFIPPIKGAQLDGVFAVRTIDDANVIKERAKISKKLVLIGGGLLGLEAGNGLRKAGMEVSVVEIYPRLLPRQLDTEGATILQKQMEEMGFTFYLGAKTQEIVKQKGGLSVCLEGGEELYADMVLISAGVRPELTLAKSLGLAIDKGVKVDDSMKTGLEDIYAAGDLIEHRGRYYGIWPASLEQGKVAGANMAGKAMKYEGTVPSNTLKVVGVDLLAAGNIDAEGIMESAVTKDETKKIYRKLVFDDNVIVGTILLGDIRGSEEIQSAIKSRKDISIYKKYLTDEAFDFSQLK
ncbi:MAG: NAD(P)/FAD-dependent oxidoreductase [Deltaproteobacteria bacterium]|nr:NAD(P)/FAD-dependent oxidoreductase [Deltaproteobacteria bacterium]MBW2306751.1 NAD(P)/FAD-dependent oxidoreductase [Deltaproteobacteria bacterium]